MLDVVVTWVGLNLDFSLDGALSTHFYQSEGFVHLVEDEGAVNRTRDLHRPPIKVGAIVVEEPFLDEGLFLVLKDGL